MFVCIVIRLGDTWAWAKSTSIVRSLYRSAFSAFGRSGKAGWGGQAVIWCLNSCTDPRNGGTYHTDAIPGAASLVQEVYASDHRENWLQLHPRRSGASIAGMP
jgi:hypothetical protein